MSKFILLNGPPRCGKDTTAKIICELYPQIVWEKFSFPHKQAFAAMVHAPIDDEGNVRGYEERKTEPLPFLNGTSYRQWQMDFSEKFMKPCYGVDVFSRLLLARCHPALTYVVSDCGFQIEVDTLPSTGVLLITILRSGCTFDGDSREYVVARSGWDHSEIRNDYNLQDLRRQVDAAVGSFMEAKP